MLQMAYMNTSCPQYFSPLTKVILFLTSAYLTLTMWSEKSVNTKALQDNQMLSRYVLDWILSGGDATAIKSPYFFPVTTKEIIHK